MQNEPNRPSWDEWFLSLAAFVAQRSKDPSTKVGAVIARPDNTIASLGYNGFPRGVPDSERWLNNREEKYQRIIHAEMNAILNAREPLKGYTLYVTPLPACERCIPHIIQAGIIRVVSKLACDQATFDRWMPQMLIAENMCTYAGVQYNVIGGPYYYVRHEARLDHAEG